MAHTIDLPICQCPRCGKLHKDALFGRPPTKEASLFAAAPDMLEALKAIAVLTFPSVHKGFASCAAEMQSLARAAIAKATGEPQP